MSKSAFAGACFTLSILNFGPQAHAADQNGYFVASFDPKSNRSVLYRNSHFEDSRPTTKKLIVACRSAQVFGTQVTGPNACHLQVGKFIPFSRSAKDGEFVQVTQTGDWLGITEGEGENQVCQTFAILAIEEMHD